MIGLIAYRGQGFWLIPLLFTNMIVVFIGLLLLADVPGFVVHHGVEACLAATFGVTGLIAWPWGRRLNGPARFPADFFAYRHFGAAPRHDLFFVRLDYWGIALTVGGFGTALGYLLLPARLLD